jgi:hypothetical protein
LKCAGRRTDVLLLILPHTHTQTNTVFSDASEFNRDLSAWDVRVVADMTNMFLGQIDSQSQSQSLCGYHWMQSSSAQLAFPTTLPQIAIDKDGTICHCPRGTYYQSRVWSPTNARLETCPPCPSGQYSPGGKVPATFCRECPAGFYCVTPAIQAPCPVGAFCPVRSTFPKALASGYYAVNSRSTYTGTQGVAERVCEQGYYCSGGNRTQCPPGSACPQGSFFSAVCPKGQYTNDAWLCVDCEAGYYCVNGIRTQCEAGQFCPLGSSAPRPCLKGSFCNVTFIQGPLAPLWGTSERPCTSGTYCPRGTSEPLSCAHGATCTVPASPELVLEPGMFDLIESEVVGGSIQYQLSLSAQPHASVIVKIVVVIKSEECYAYDESSKFNLDRMEFEFGPDNYSLPQIVVSHFLTFVSQSLFVHKHFYHTHFFTIITQSLFSQSLFQNHFFQNVTVNRLNTARYEGTHSATFQHSIETEDEDFSAAFLRPVLLTLQGVNSQTFAFFSCFFLRSFTIAHRAFKMTRNALPMPARLKTRPQGSVVVAAWMVTTSSTPTRNTATASSNVAPVQKG